MKSLLSSVLFASLLLPACLTADTDDVETSEVEGDVTISVPTSSGRKATKIATTGNGYALWASGFSAHAQFYDASGGPLPVSPVTLTSSTGTKWTTYTDSNGVAEVRARDYAHLGTLGPRTFTWSYAGSSTRSAASASFTVTFIRTDCFIEYVTHRLENGKHKVEASLLRSGDFATEGGHALEFSLDGKVVGTAITQVGHGDAEVVLPGPTDHGTIDVQFAGNATIAGCATSREFDLTPTPVRLWVTPNLSTARIGASTVTLHAQAESNGSGLPKPRPNTHMKIYASHVGVIGNLYDGTFVGEVTTGPNGDAYLTLPVTAIAGSPVFTEGTIAFTASSDDPLINDEMYQTNYAGAHTMVVSATDVKLKLLANVQNADLSRTRTYSVTKAANDAPIAGVELDGACNDWKNAVTDANGRLTCTYSPTWYWSNAAGSWLEEGEVEIRYPDAWNVVY
jgi:hypothetical protein